MPLITKYAAAVGEIKTTKYCVLINNNNGYILGKKTKKLFLPQAVCSPGF